MSDLDLKTIRNALARLGAVLDEENIQCHICLYGGSAMMFISDLSNLSKDIDYRVVPFDGMATEHLRSLESIVRRAAFAVGESLNLDVDWMNDAVKIFASEYEDYSSEMTFGNGALQVLTPSPKCLLAMKCLCLRDDETLKDANAVKILLKVLNIRDLETVNQIVKQYFPRKDIPLEQMAKIDGILKELSDAGWPPQ
ncbi:MAG: hypothetical protein J5846_04730 [Desulfovibrio sp.]|nr:hypothetical protein [Desulfovibrio sp.]